MAVVEATLPLDFGATSALAAVVRPLVGMEPRPSYVTEVAVTSEMVSVLGILEATESLRGAAAAKRERKIRREKSLESELSH